MCCERKSWNNSWTWEVVMHVCMFVTTLWERNGATMSSWVNVYHTHPRANCGSWEVRGGPLNRENVSLYEISCC